MFALITWVLAFHRSFAYPSGYWHFTSLSDPGPYVNVLNGGIGNGSLIVSSAANTYASIDSSFMVGGACTFVMRFYPATLTLNSRLIEFGKTPGTDIMISVNGADLLVQSANKSTTATQATCSNFITQGKWHIVVVSFAVNASVSVSLNGTQFCSFPGVSLETVSRSSQLIGKSINNFPMFNGNIDFVWYLPRPLGYNELPVITIEAEMMADAWTFQSPTVLGPDLSLVGGPDLTGGVINFHGNASQYGVVNSNRLFGGSISIATRVKFNAYQQYSRIIDFGNGPSSDNIVLTAVGQTDQASLWVYSGSSLEMVTMSSCFPLNTWVDIVATVGSGTSWIYRNGGATSATGSMWNPTPMFRASQFIGKSLWSSDSPIDASIEYIMLFSRTLGSSDADYITSSTALRNPSLRIDFDSTSLLSPALSMVGNLAIGGGVLTLTGNIAQYVGITSAMQFGGAFTMSFRFLVSTTSSVGYSVVTLGNTTSDTFEVLLVGTTVNVLMPAPTGSFRQTVSCGLNFVVNKWTDVVIQADNNGAMAIKVDQSMCLTSAPLWPVATRTIQRIGWGFLGAGFNGQLDYWRYAPNWIPNTGLLYASSAFDRDATQCPQPDTSLIPRAGVGTCVSAGRIGSSCNLACGSIYPVQLVNNPGTCSIIAGGEGAAWRGMYTECYAQCSSPQPLVNGQIILQPNARGPLVEGQVLTRSCNSGFALQGNASTVCQATASGGQWSSADALCGPIYCGPLQTPANGQVICAGGYGMYSLLNQCNFTCNAGFDLSGPTGFTCSANTSAWDPPVSVLVCNPRTCPTPNINQGINSCSPGLYGGSYTYQTNCTFGCQAGYAISSTNTFTCQATGSWSTVLPVCSLRLCPSLAQPNNGSMSCTNGTNGVSWSGNSVCSYSCNPGYSLQNGNSTLTCSPALGTWSSSVPRCLDINECLLSPCPQSSTCTNSPGNYSCSPVMGKIISSITGSQVLSSVRGELVHFWLYMGYNAQIVLSPTFAMLNTYGQCANATTTLISAGNYTVTCQISAGMGSGLSLSNSFILTTSPELGSQVCSSSFSFPAFALVNTSLRQSNTTVGSSQVFCFDYETGDVLSMKVMNFIPDPNIVQVYLQSGLGVRTPCTLRTDLSNATLLTCQTQPFTTGSNLVIFVTGSGFNVVGFDTYSVSNVANVLAVLAIPGTGCQNSTITSVSNCPTNGTNIIIQANYVTDPFYAFVSGILCSRISQYPLICDNSSVPVCTFGCLLSAGTGFDRTVVVASNNKYSQTLNLLSYAEPTIVSIVGCTSTGPLTVINCARAGGDILTIWGSNFGASGANVFIGGVLSPAVIHNSLNPHGQLSCVLPPGYDVAQQVQVFQAAGPFSETVAELDYTQCSFGQFQNGTSSTCSECSPGTYLSTNGSISCSTCDPGRYSDQSGASACNYCQAGYAQNLRGMAYCVPCDPGSYTGDQGALSCLECDAGTQAPWSNSTTCIDCHPGSMSTVNGTSGPTSCDLCPRGWFTSLTKASKCNQCPSGQFSNSTGSQICQNCPLGRYQPLAGNDTCLTCPPGTYSSTPGRSDCLPCEAGTEQVENGASSCDVCHAGWVSQKVTGQIGPLNCTACQPGEYMPNPGQAVCLVCPPGSYSNTTEATLCVDCPPGYSQPDSGATYCEICDPGTFTALFGRPGCSLCSSGSHTNVTGATSCNVCEAGSYSLSTGAPIVDCTPCHPGEYINSRGQAACLQCPAGWFADTEGTIQCVPCPAGLFSPSAGALACSACTPGRYSSEDSASACLACPVGQFISDYGATTCLICPEGSYQGTLASTSCTACPPGQFTSAAGQEACAACPAGKYAPRTNSTMCLDCELGQFQPATAVGSSACALCSPGQFASEVGLAVCSVCSAGAYSLVNASTCTDCSEGTYQNAPQSSSCLPCPIGLISGVPGQTACTTCPAGYTSLANASVQCEPCPAGSYRDESMELCALCPVGTSAYAGSAACNPCASGLVAMREGMVTCESCPSGSSVDKTRTLCNCNPGSFMNQNETCQACPVGANCADPGVTYDSIPTADGYYLPNSDTLLYQKCLSPKSCVGGQCVNHRAGMLCNQCANGYSMSDWTKTCSKCSSASGSSASMTILLLFLVGVVSVLYIYIIQAAFRKDVVINEKPDSPQSGTGAGNSAAWSRTEASQQSKRFQSPTRQPSNSIQDSRQSKDHSRTRSGSFQDADVVAKTKLLDARAARDTYVLKIIAYFFQVASSLISLPVAGAIAFPTYYMQFLSYFKFLSVDFMPWQTVTCFVPINFYVKMTTLTLVPVVILPTLAAAIALASWFIKRNPKTDNDIYGKGKLVWVRASIFTLFLLYPAVSSRVLSHFVCLPLANLGRSVLIADFSIQCYGRLWMSWTPYVSVMVFVYPIGVPLLFFVLLYRSRNNLQSPFATLGLGFLHQSYMAKMWWFEVLVMIQKLILTSLLQFFPSNMQLPAGLISTSLYLIIILLQRPEIRKRNWILHQLANVHLSLLLLMWHFSYKEDITRVPALIDGLASTLFISLTVGLLIMLCFDFIWWALHQGKNFLSAWRKSHAKNTD